MLGVTLTPTMVSASEKINVIPAQARLKVDCRVPPDLGEDHARARIEEVIGERGLRHSSSASRSSATARRSRPR